MGKLREHKGFTLLEVLIALVVLSLGILGTLGMVASSIQSNSFSRQMSVATSLASDKIEEMKNTSYNGLLGTPPPPMDEKDVNADGALPSSTVVAVDDGINACSPLYPCGDVAAGDGIWTYALQATVDGKTYDRIWTVELNPVVDGLTLSSSMKLESIVSWVDGEGRSHNVRLGTLLTR